jgi:hypothetical protein
MSMCERYLCVNQKCKEGSMCERYLCVSQKCKGGSNVNV